MEAGSRASAGRSADQASDSAGPRFAGRNAKASPSSGVLAQGPDEETEDGGWGQGRYTPTSVESLPGSDMMR